jgi:hypothetical protein
MLGEPGTQAYFARPPRRRNLTKDEQRQKELIDNPYRLLQRDENYNQADHVVTELQLLPMDAAPAPAPKEPEVKKFKPVGVEAPSKENPTGDLTVVAERRDTKTTVFVALHEPYEKATWYLDRFERLAQTDEALAVRIGSRSGAPTHVDDRVLLRFGPADPAQPVTLEGGGESFTFAGHGYVRITADAVKVAGDVRALKVRVTGEPKLVINGKNTPARIKDGVLHFGA